MGLAARRSYGGWPPWRTRAGWVRNRSGWRPARLGVSERTVWRWVRQAHAGEGLDRRPHRRFQVTDEIRQRLAFWRGGNAAAVHRELAAAAKAGGPPAPSPVLAWAFHADRATRA
jgi:hypothetical protein